MDEFAAGQAAKWLGITEEAVHKAAREGRLKALSGEGPRRFSRAALEEYHRTRAAGHVAALARSGETPVSAARKVRRALDEKGSGLPRSFEVRLKAMPVLWRAPFNRAELAAADVRDGCRWCRAREFSAVLGLRPPRFSEALQALFGAPPCGECSTALVRPYLDVLVVRVHAGGRRPAGPSPRPSEAERDAAREWAVRHPVTAAARPVQADDGRALVARRRRQVQERLKAANRAGDAAYAEQLARQMMALRADAAAVDGRQPKSRPGRLRCGHLLAENCACPRRASRRATS